MCEPKLLVAEVGSLSPDPDSKVLSLLTGKRINNMKLCICEHLVQPIVVVLL